MQQHKTNMINEEWNKTQNDAPFVAFYDMRAVMFVLPDEMADVSIVGLQWFILIPRLNHTGSHRLIIPIPYPIYMKKKNNISVDYPIRPCEEYTSTTSAQRTSVKCSSY